MNFLIITTIVYLIFSMLEKVISLIIMVGATRVAKASLARARMADAEDERKMEEVTENMIKQGCTCKPVGHGGFLADDSCPFHGRSDYAQ